MLYTVYILFSEKYDKIYIGFSSHLINRFHSHNQYGTKGWTIKFRPWTVIYCEHFEDKKEAMRREKQLKSSTFRRIIRSKITTEYMEWGFISNLLFCG